MSMDITIAAATTAAAVALWYEQKGEESDYSDSSTSLSSDSFRRIP